jgi:hypothetical protein
MADLQPTATKERSTEASAVPTGVLAVIHGTTDDPVLQPGYLGEAPVLIDGRCSRCGLLRSQHTDRDGEQLPIREWHRQNIGRPNGFYADEIGGRRHDGAV